MDFLQRLKYLFIEFYEFKEGSCMFDSKFKDFFEEPIKLFLL